MPEVVVGPEAIDHLMRAYPRAHIFFGAHASADHFALTLEGERWTVVECAGCWTFFERMSKGNFSGHFFCPEGFNLRAVRACLEHVFRHLGAKVVVGITPEGHECERQARVAARALGMTKQNGVYALTLERMMAYTQRNTPLRGD
jgi:hypothetical protein